MRRRRRWPRVWPNRLGMARHKVPQTLTDLCVEAGLRLDHAVKYADRVVHAWGDMTPCGWPMNETLAKRSTMERESVTCRECLDALAVAR